MKFIDLFSGCGGLSLGLLNAGFTGLFAIEKNKDAFATLKLNLVDPKQSVSPLNGRYQWDKVLPQEAMGIDELIHNHAEYLRKLGTSQEVDLIVGGPPCQGFSMAGRRIADDPRNYLVYRYLDVVSKIHPKFLLMENVKGFTMKFKECQRDTSSIVKHRVAREGYIPIAILERSDAWGVPQTRNRYVLLGVRANQEGLGNAFHNKTPLELEQFGNEISGVIKESLEKYAKEFREKKGLPEIVNTGDAIGDLKVYEPGSVTTKRELIEAEDFAPKGRFSQIKTRNISTSHNSYLNLMRKGWNKDLPNGGLRIPNHTQKVLERFKTVLRDFDNGHRDNIKLERRKSLPIAYRKLLGSNKHTHTVLDKFSPSVTVTTLPDDMLHFDEPRILTVRECARLQSFPDWFEFTGPYTSGGQRRKKSCPKYTQVGNAVPPLMAEGLAMFIKERLVSVIMQHSNIIQAANRKS